MALRRLFYGFNRMRQKTYSSGAAAEGEK